MSQALDYALVIVAVLSAFIGAFVGNRFLKQMTMPSLQNLVAMSLFLAALGLIAGIL